METREVHARLSEALGSVSPEERFTVFKAFKLALPAELHEAVDVAFDFFTYGMQSRVAAVRKIVVALVHGIRTDGGWQEKARQALQKEGEVSVVPLGFEFYDVVRFLGPWREEPISRIERKLRDLPRLYPDHDLVIIAHSFGTYIISKILQRAPDIRVLRLLLCGSIISAKYKWDSLPHEKLSCVNDVGTRDVWPVFARVFSFDYGCSGSFGFKDPRVIDRYFNYGHSDFFANDHYERFWRPFVWRGEIAASPWDLERPTTPWLLSALGGVPFVKVILLVVVALIFLACYGIFACVTPFF